MRKSDVARPYPPDFCSVETLAYRLDCSTRAVHDYAASGLLPKPVTIGNLSRWSWSDVCEHIGQQNAVQMRDRAAPSAVDDDEYSSDIIKLRAKAARQARKEADGCSS